MYLAIRNLFYILLILLTGSCKTPVQEGVQSSEDPYEKPLIEANQYLRERNRELICAFTDRVAWDMTETATGLWYMILEEGKGERLKKQQNVTYSYETRLLDGTFCYGSDTNMPKNIVLGKGNVEAGLEEGFLLLHKNDKARFIIPPYLAHGNFGDGNKIPGSSILIITVEVLDVN